ncbi:hypothetical protein Tco_1210617 [Tanacetum coccineum]
MSSDNASYVVTYTSISSQARSRSIPTGDPYEEDTRQALEQASPPLSPAYVPDPIELEDHVPVYVPEPAYPEYLAPSDDEIPMEDQPLPDDASPDLKEDPADYPTDGGDDDDDESSDDDDDDDDDDDEEDEEEEEHLALADSTTIASLAVDTAEETELFEIDEFAATPPPPPAYCTTSRMSVRSQAPIPFPSEAEFARILALPTLPPSPLTPLSSPLPQIPPPPTSSTYAQASLGCKAAMMRAAPSPTPSPPLLLPSTTRIADIPEADIPPQKRLLLTAPTPRFEVEERLLLTAPTPRRTERVARECTYSDFLKCQPLNFNGTKGIVRLTQWFERIESVFHISKCGVGNQVKYATCTLLGNALTWWNSHVKTVGHDAAYGMPGLPDMIQGSVMASKPKKMQDAIEFATELMDQKICTLAESQAENKKKFEDISRNNDDIK